MLLKIMRDDPSLLRSEFGMAAHAAAIKKVKGTEWEAILFEKPTSLMEKRGWDMFRERTEYLYECADTLSNAELEKRKQASVTYIAESKARRQRGEKG